MRNLDFSLWQGLLSTIFGLALVTLIAVGLRLLVMQRIQERRERENRQINERQRTLMRDLHLRREDESTSKERSRRIRDAVEAALSDVVLLGTEDQVRLAALAAAKLVAAGPAEAQPSAPAWEWASDMGRRQRRMTRKRGDRLPGAKGVKSGAPGVFQVRKLEPLPGRRLNIIGGWKRPALPWARTGIQGKNG